MTADRDKIIAAARLADSGFDGAPDADGTMSDSIVGIEAVTRFYAIAFAAGAASRDAEVAQWQNIIDEEAKDSALVIIERDQLSAQINRLLDAVKVVEADSEEVLDFDECTAMCIPMDTYHGLIEAAEATCEQSIAAYRNKVIEECAAVLNVAITRLSSCGASIKNDVAISTLKEQSCRLRAMKEQP